MKTKLIYFILSITFPFVLLGDSLDKNIPVKKSNIPNVKIWYKDFLFKNQSLNFEGIRILGEAYYQGSDIGEVVSSLRSIKTTNPEIWYKTWLETGNRINNLAKKYENDGNIISAKKAYFRASNYYRTSGFYMDSPNNRNISIDLSEKSVNCFRNAIKYDSSIKSIKVPYENTTLPGYLLKPEISNNTKVPLLICFTGFDGTKEELYFSVGKAAQERGYAVILFDGPGQGEVIRKQKLPFRYDWEKVVTPVINFAVKISYVEKTQIAIMGRSMGGYLAPRAAAYDKRIKACIANGGVFDFSQPVLKNFPASFLKLMTEKPEVFNKEIFKIAEKNNEFSWFLNNGMWTFNAETPSAFFKKLAKFSMRDSVKNIKCNMLVIDSSNDIFMKGQPQKLYNSLECSKTFLLFDEETTGEAHCQEGATAISNAEIFNWLNKTLDYHPFQKN